MDDRELSDLLRQAGAQSPEPTPRLALQTIEAYRLQFDRPPWLARHWRLATAATVLLAIGVFYVRPSGGSLLPPDYAKPRFLFPSGRIQRHTDRIGNGWKMEWRLATVGPDARIFCSTDVWLTTSERDRIVFHRYFGDLDTNTWYGYDAVLDPHRPSGKVTFQLPSERPKRIPGAYASGARFVPIQNFPTEAFETGQNIAVTFVSFPETGRKVVDYIRIDSIGVFDTLQDVASSLIHRYFGHPLSGDPSSRDRDSRPLQNR